MNTEFHKNLFLNYHQFMQKHSTTKHLQSFKYSQKLTFSNMKLDLPIPRNLVIYTLPLKQINLDGDRIIKWKDYTVHPTAV